MLETLKHCRKIGATLIVAKLYSLPKRGILSRTLIDKGMSLTDMARRLNYEGFVAPKGGKFKASQVAVLLKRYRLR